MKDIDKYYIIANSVIIVAILGLIAFVIYLTNDTKYLWCLLLIPLLTLQNRHKEKNKEK